MNNIKIRKWDDSKGYIVEIEITPGMFDTPALIEELIQSYLDNPAVESVEYNGEVKLGRFNNPIKVL